MIQAFSLQKKPLIQVVAKVVIDFGDYLKKKFSSILKIAYIITYRYSIIYSTKNYFIY